MNIDQGSTTQKKKNANIQGQAIKAISAVENVNKKWKK